MAGETSGTYFTADAVVDLTAVDTFIPEIWSDEVIAAYKKTLKMAPLVKRLPMVGKKGDVVNIPKPVRGAAAAKAEATAVTIQANAEGTLDIPINRHFEYSRFIEDIVEVQALGSLRRFYTDDAGYALADRIDTDLVNCFTGIGTNGTKTFAPSDATSWINDATYYVNASSGLAAYVADTVATGDNFTDLAFREAIKVLDDNNVPMDGRSLVIPPAARKTLLGIDRFVSSDFRDERSVASGYIGNIYGVDIYVSTNCPLMETSAQNGVGAIDVRGCLFFHSEAVVLAEQMNVRSQTQYKQEYLSTLYTADTVYGAEVFRPEAALVIAIADE